MPTPTYVALAKTVLTGTQATVTFSSIVGTYTDLVLLVSSRTTGSSGGFIYLEFNNSAGTAYSGRNLYGFSSAAYSDTQTGQAYLFIPNITNSTQTANTFGSTEIYIPNYAGSTNKIVSAFGVQESNSATGVSTTVMAGLWSNTAAITQIKLTPQSGNFDTGSRFDLYGIKNS